MFLYSIVTNDRRKYKVEAESAEEALAITGILLEDCKKWYPFPCKKILSEEERLALKMKMEKLRNNIVYKANKELKQRVKQKTKAKVKLERI